MKYLFLFLMHYRKSYLKRAKIMLMLKINWRIALVVSE